MAVVRKTVTVTAQQDKWIKAQIESGYFTNDSEYLRSLIRQDQASSAKSLNLKQALKEGLESGIGEKNLPEIMREVEKKMKADGRL
jgi:antitoxin ParD1/3/4